MKTIPGLLVCKGESEVGGQRVINEVSVSREPRSRGYEQIASGHFGRLLHAEKKQKCRRDIGENSALAAEFRGVLRDVDEMHDIGRVRSI